MNEHAPAGMPTELHEIDVLLRGYAAAVRPAVPSRLADRVMRSATSGRPLARWRLPRLRLIGAPSLMSAGLALLVAFGGSMAAVTLSNRSNEASPTVSPSPYRTPSSSPAPERPDRPKPALPGAIEPGASLPGAWPIGAEPDNDHSDDAESVDDDPASETPNEDGDGPADEGDA